ncbi:CAP domain-containing protein [Spongiivirga sp. MCCC 1A20706]|uniref:CAP domain-containing protein n=1 Tax=Spongiivirga sp. MCCC 1A20706 TaxID=3160963 RepID=UPI0039777075
MTNLLTRLAMLCLLLTTAPIFFSCSADDAPFIEEPTSFTEDQRLALEVHQRVNAYRVENDLSPLTFDREVSEIAKEHSVQMLTERSATHKQFDVRHLKVEDMTDAQVTGENVAKGYKTADGVIHAWINSKEHYANMIHDYTHTGIGVVKGDDGEAYYTQIFYKK